MQDEEENAYLEVAGKNGAALFRRQLRGEVVMLNLLRFRSVADYSGTGGDYLIGPCGEGWDMVLLIRQKSVDGFVAFATDQNYMKGIGHRIAALRDSRIIPLEDMPELSD